MGKLPPGVIFRMMRGSQLSMCMAQLIYEGAQPFAEMIDASTGELAGVRIKLPQSKLELIEDERAGRPAWYLCREILVEPQ